MNPCTASLEPRPGEKTGTLHTREYVARVRYHRNLAKTKDDHFRLSCNRDMGVNNNVPCKEIKKAGNQRLSRIL